MANPFSTVYNLSKYGYRKETIRGNDVLSVPRYLSGHGNEPPFYRHGYGQISHFPSPT